MQQNQGGKKQFYTINGINPGSLKQFIDFQFGPGFLFKINKNVNTIMYDIYLFDRVGGKKIDHRMIQKWQKHWGKSHNLIIIPSGSTKDSIF